jgi:hypothetical protein
MSPPSAKILGYPGTQRINLSENIKSWLRTFFHPKWRELDTDKKRGEAYEEALRHLDDHRI